MIINDLSSISYLNQELLTAGNSAGTLIQYRYRYSGQFVKITIKSMYRYGKNTLRAHPVEIAWTSPNQISIVNNYSYESLRADLYNQRFY